MKPSSSRALLLSTAFFASAAAGHAHPGHDGHELTWDFSHLAAHPVATIGCLAVVAAAGWAGWRTVRRLQSLRGSQASRGK